MQSERHECRGKNGAKGGNGEILRQTDIEEQSDIGGKCQVFPMRKIGDSLNAENQRGAHGGERQYGAGDQAVQRQLCKLLQHEPLTSAPDRALRSGPGGRVAPASPRPPCLGLLGLEGDRIYDFSAAVWLMLPDVIS